MEENLKINKEILEQVAEFMTSILYDLKGKYPLYQSELKDEDIPKIRNTMLEEFKRIAKDTDKISMYAHYDGDKLLDEIFRKADIDFKGGLISLMVYPNDFCCTIHKDYATYWCNPGMDSDKEYKVPETIIALTQEGAKRIIEQANRKISELTIFADNSINIKNREKILEQVKKVENYLDRNKISNGKEPLEERIKQLDDFRPKYDSWEFLYEDGKKQDEVKNHQKVIEYTSEYITALLYDNCLSQKISGKNLREIRNFITQKLKENTEDKDIICININELTKEINNNILNCFEEKINDDIHIYRDYSIQISKDKSESDEKKEKIIALTEEGARRIMKETNDKIWKLAGNENNKEEIRMLMKEQQSVEDYLDKHGIKRIEGLKNHKPIYGSLDFNINCREEDGERE